MPVEKHCDCCGLLRAAHTLDDDGLCTKCVTRGCKPGKPAKYCEEDAEEEMDEFYRKGW